MIPYLIAGAVGFLFAGRNRPKTKLRKTAAFGVRTGTEYIVEEIPGVLMFVVHAQDGTGTSAVFQKRVIPGQPQSFQFVRGTGSPMTIDLMRKDFEP